MNISNDIKTELQLFGIGAKIREEKKDDDKGPPTMLKCGNINQNNSSQKLCNFIL